MNTLVPQRVKGSKEIDERRRVTWVHAWNQENVVGELEIGEIGDFVL